MKTDYSRPNKAGLSGTEWKQYTDILTKANDQQIAALTRMANRELQQRLERRNWKFGSMIPPSWYAEVDQYLKEAQTIAQENNQ